MPLHSSTIYSASASIVHCLNTLPQCTGTMHWHCLNALAVGIGTMYWHCICALALALALALELYALALHCFALHCGLKNTFGPENLIEL